MYRKPVNAKLRCLHRFLFLLLKIISVANFKSQFESCQNHNVGQTIKESKMLSYKADHKIEIEAGEPGLEEKPRYARLGFINVQILKLFYKNHFTGKLFKVNIIS